MPLRTSNSGMLTPIVSALTRTSPSSGRGVGTSTYSSTDGPPVRRSRMAFIRRRAPSALGDDRIAEHADSAVDLDLDHVSRLHPQGRLTGEADPLRRAGRDDVAGDQRRPIRAIRDQGWNVEDQVVDPGVLDLLAVEPGHQMETRRVGDFVRGDDPRAKPASRVEILAGGDRMLELDVPYRAVVEAGVTKDMAQGVGFGDVAAGLADDQRQLALVVEVAGDLRAHHRLVVRDERVDEPQKDRWVLRRWTARLGRMGAIVAPGADDLVGVGDRWQQTDLRQGYIRGRALHIGSGSAEHPAGDRSAQCWVPFAEPAPQIDDAVTDDHAVGAASCRSKANQFHGASSLSTSALKT